MTNVLQMLNRSDSMNITVEVKSVYGNEMIYPHCATAKNFCKLLGQKTLTRADLEIIKNIGFTVQQHHSKVL